jgi:hypothetical protein
MMADVLITYCMVAVCWLFLGALVGLFNYNEFKRSISNGSDVFIKYAIKERRWAIAGAIIAATSPVWPFAVLAGFVWFVLVGTRKIAQGFMTMLHWEP